ncbi:alpha/beta hydrolase [Ketobacter sp.]|uniref:alpha/beta hydrolase n=1 Tax=Ketobacter sp. TaxID=2083498 RepID=UPI000F135ACB|nr:alpha/beta fold hydrolase [Ketobacter sp.]RLT95351.1 MAG: alpha/beta fold hydrolase [Ketobacter sp.]
MKSLRTLGTAVVLCLATVLTGCGGDSNPKGLYVAKTADGLDIKMKRYRPTPNHSFRNSTPILLFPGITLNFNQFDVYSPPWLNSYHYKLPADAPAWAKNDPIIQDDNLKYFSMAHYLYLRGYDVWMANYRGVGRGDFDSDEGHPNTNLDVWCALDYPAAVDKVRAVTGKKPVIGGHSTGGLCAYLYLQGYSLDASIVKQGDYIPHATASAALAAQRNANVAGFLGIDPAGAPILAYEWLIDNPLIWDILALEWYIDLDTILPYAMSLLPPVITSGAIDLVFKLVTQLADAFPSFFPHWADLFGALDFWRTGNMNGYVEDFHARIAFSSFYLGGFAQYADWGTNGVFREFWQNGAENQNLVNPPDQAPGDGYYYFDTNMSRMTVPAFSVFSDASGLVDTDTMVDTLYNGKTYNSKDAWIEVPGSGHIDVVNGNASPTVAFPAIADWLDSL